MNDMDRTRVPLIGAELEENIGLRYVAAALEQRGSDVSVIPFSSKRNPSPFTVAQPLSCNARIAGLSTMLIGGAREFCHLVQALRGSCDPGHLIAGRHLASFDCKRLVQDFPVTHSAGLHE